MRFTAKRKNRFVTSSDLNSQILPPIVENQKFTRGCNQGCRPLLSIVVCPGNQVHHKSHKKPYKQDPVAVEDLAMIH